MDITQSIMQPEAINNYHKQSKKKERSGKAPGSVSDNHQNLTLYRINETITIFI
jgi:hypothetical protein